MIRVGIAVEGETEEDFVRHVLAGYLVPYGVWPHPALPGRRGGNISVQRIARGMRELLRGFDAVTTLVDFYGFKRKEAKTPVELESAIVDQLNRTVGNPVSTQRVFAYVQRHEFEALLFSDVERFRCLPTVSQESVSSLADVRKKFDTPEDIDDDPETAPSKRLLRSIPGYDKRVDGLVVAAEIGVDQIRSECPRFRAWLEKLQTLPAVLGQQSQ